MPPAWMFGRNNNHRDGNVLDDEDTSHIESSEGHDDEYNSAEHGGISREGGLDSEAETPYNTAGQHTTTTNAINNSLDNADGTEVVHRGTGFESVNSSVIPKDGFYISKPYKREIIAQQLNDNTPGANRRMATIGALRDLGVKVFIIEAKSIQTTADILHHVRRVVGFVARENRHVRQQPPLPDEQFLTGDAPPETTLGFQRCLLYQDKTGRLFNLTLSPHAVGPAAKFEDYLSSFSGMQALVALAILARSFSCASTETAIEQVKPAVLAVILGLVLNEEISLSWLNANMLIRASPSVAAHALTSMLGSDLMQRAVLLSLALAGAAEGGARKGLTILGISGACLLLLSNLGSRAWHFMGWRPLGYQGPGAAAMAWLLSIVTGLAFPWMAHRKIHVGGRAAMEYVMLTAIVVGLAYLISGVDQMQRFSLVTTEACDQDVTNLTVGGWFFVTCAFCLYTVLKMPYNDQLSQSSSDSEPLLVKDHTSPVGFKVPGLPDFEMDPSLAWTGSLCLSPKMEFMLGLLIAAIVGGGIAYLGFEGWDEDAVDEIESQGRDWFGSGSQ